MRSKKFKEEPILDGLMSVFRAKGYDGASLKELADATGLKKASLYHRFPGGKKDMTIAVLSYLEKWIHLNIYNVLQDNTKNAEKRLEEVLEGILEIYKGGKEVCVYRSLSLDGGIALFGDQIRQGIERWNEGFKLFGLEKGMTEEEAIDKANQSFIEIQGSLVLCQTMDVKEPFLEVLEKIRNRYN